MNLASMIARGAFLFLRSGILGHLIIFRTDVGALTINDEHIFFWYGSTFITGKTSRQPNDSENLTVNDIDLRINIR